MPDWAIVAIIGVVVLFGASKLPEIARNLGRSSGEFKKGLKEGHDDPARAVPPENASTPRTTASEPSRDDPRTDPTI
ncbi:MAG: twin-arginine translocase TatA/TatE family subunit [Actinomycetota bacterium]|nr:twin-arginine translocase TatA/TatE family subunit [Actinomycetota bacterium]